MPPFQSSCFNNNELQLSFPRRSLSPYRHHPQVHLREDSKGHIKGVDYLSGTTELTSEDSDDHYISRQPQSPTTAASTSLFARTSLSKRNIGRRDSTGSLRKSYSGTDTGTPSNSVRLWPSPGRKPSADFTLSSPETSGKDGLSDDEDEDSKIPHLQLQATHLPRRHHSRGRPKSPSIRKGPLLNRDLLRFGNETGGDTDGLDIDMEPMMFELSLSGDERAWGFGRRTRSSCRHGRQREDSDGPKGERTPGDDDHVQNRHQDHWTLSKRENDLSSGNC